MAHNSKSKNRPVLLSPEEMHADLKTLSDQLAIIEHLRDDDAIKAIRAKYKFKAPWE